ncbi:valine--tRNA ligase [Alterileibacterium massiliense]|uniref:valine--tRNA ligase n=1 Tax=Alterileibacterium massiliense TaxID=1870997 RepID=UPI0008D989D3|nr:valine--tRNA ligase [Alterileibacterium massiliense]
MSNNLNKNYNPKDFEDRIYRKWEENGAFNAEVDRDKKPFCIVMPPPNITGQLHMGHALDHTLQDTLVRWKRMEGYSTLWVPGSDHASIATEVKVNNKLKEETGKDKKDIGRDAFLKRAWEWKEEYGGKITEQCRKLGDSCDWRRERFTMDEGCNNAVKTFFIELYNKGQIYRGNRLVNWCPCCETTLSDAEVLHEDKAGKYWYFRYFSEDGGDGIVVATSRPETMFGDVAIAVNPEDERYKHLVGKNVILPIVGRKIPVIEDPYPDMEKGTGAVKITPAHDFNDFEVGKRHNLEVLNCIDKEAKMTALAGKYEGMDRYECRKAWVKELSSNGFLVKTEDVVIPVGECYRCNTTVEPMISDQWFVKMEELAKPAIEAAKSGKLKHVPERFEKTYLHWLSDIHDWCISRQLWWGHRIPAYYCKDCGEIIVSKDEPKKCPKCGSQNIYQDDDVLDTWFSSALWPFSTLGWPEKTKELDYFYPNSVIVTGYDILFFWVIRMVFSGCEIMKEPPFEYIFLHGLVRDEEGRKMSKSLGNGIDPLEIIDEVGADALRFMLSSGITPGNDMRFIRNKLEASRNFANKLWNASRFTIMNLKDDKGEFLPMASSQTVIYQDEDKWMLSLINDGIKVITEHLGKFELSIAGQKIYDLIWNEYCDWYIELVKRRLYGNDEKDKLSARYVLQKSLKTLLKLLHPFMPFITEEIWGYLPKEEAEKDLLISEAWPKHKKLNFDESREKIEMAKDIIKVIRNIRAEADTPPSRSLSLIIVSDKKAKEIEASSGYIKSLANVSKIEIIQDKSKAPRDVMSGIVDGAEILIPMEDLIDFEAEILRLQAEKKRLIKEVDRVNKKLSNKNFVDKAPQKIVDEERAKGEKYEEMLEKVIDRLKSMSEANN